MDEKMIITGMRIDNFKKIEFIDQKLDPKMNIISGKNGSGKTSMIESMIMAIEGKTAMGKSPERLIRQGSDKSVVEVSLTNSQGKELSIERTITPKGVYLKASYEDGTSVTQTDLNLIMDSSTINMMGLLHMKPSEQIDFIKKVGGINTDAIEKEYKDKYGDRRSYNRVHGDAKTLVRSLGDVTEVQEVDIQASLSEIDAMDKHNKKMEAIQVEIKSISLVADNADREIEVHNVAITKANQLIAEAKAAIVAKKAEAKEATKSIAAKRKTLKPRKDTAPAREELKEADKINKKAAEYIRYLEAVAAEDKAAKDVNVVEVEMEALIAEREKIISSSKLPFNNIKFHKELGVLVDGIAFDDMSTAQKIKIMAKIYMKSNPSLNVIYIQDGSLLDKETLQEIVDMSDLKDFQFLIEIVGEAEEGIVMREGAIVGAEKKEEIEDDPEEKSGDSL